jgi:hypothetical protein
VVHGHEMQDVHEMDAMDEDDVREEVDEMERAYATTQTHDQLHEACAAQEMWEATGDVAEEEEGEEEGGEEDEEPARQQWRPQQQQWRGMDAERGGGLAGVREEVERLVALRVLAREAQAQTGEWGWKSREAAGGARAEVQEEEREEEQRRRREWGTAPSALQEAPVAATQASGSGVLAGERAEEARSRGRGTPGFGREEMASAAARQVGDKTGLSSLRDWLVMRKD